MLGELKIPHVSFKNQPKNVIPNQAGSVMKEKLAAHEYYRMVSALGSGNAQYQANRNLD